MNSDLIDNLINEAKDIANQNFCCKYSNFTVGVALLTIDNKVYKGFNIENYGIQSICAERTAFAKALSEGNKKFQCLAVVGKKIDEKKFKKTVPCGYCLQFIKEYTTDNFMIYTFDDIENKVYSYKITELLPNSFKM